MTALSLMVATRRMRPPWQRGQAKTSRPKLRRSNSDQAIRRCLGIGSGSGTGGSVVCSAVGAVRGNLLVDQLLIVGAIARKGIQLAVGLAQQRWNSRGIRGVTGR
jgi:hypothetical protein